MLFLETSFIYLKKKKETFWLHPMASGILIPLPGREPTHHALEGRVWTTKDVLRSLYFYYWHLSSILEAVQPLIL